MLHIKKNYYKTNSITKAFMLKYKTELPIKMAQSSRLLEKYPFQNYSFSSLDIQFYSQSPVSVGKAWSF